MDSIIGRVSSDVRLGGVEEVRLGGPIRPVNGSVSKSQARKALSSVVLQEVEAAGDCIVEGDDDGGLLGWIVGDLDGVKVPPVVGRGVNGLDFGGIKASVVRYPGYVGDFRDRSRVNYGG